MKSKFTKWNWMLAYATSKRAQAIAKDMGVSDKLFIEPINLDELLPKEFMKLKRKKNA
jgi:hypothetical protein